MTIHPDMSAELDVYRRRHTATQHAMKWLMPNPRLNGHAYDVAYLIWETAVNLATILEDGPELTTGLRKLREAKDCLVIQGLEDKEAK